jgi:hypothetical protein
MNRKFMDKAKDCLGGPDWVWGSKTNGQIKPEKLKYFEETLGPLMKWEEIKKKECTNRREAKKRLWYDQHNRKRPKEIDNREFDKIESIKRETTPLAWETETNDKNRTCKNFITDERLIKQFDNNAKKWKKDWHDWK